jgi:hypothetical protein
MYVNNVTSSHQRYLYYWTLRPISSLENILRNVMNEKLNGLRNLSEHFGGQRNHLLCRKQSRLLCRPSLKTVTFLTTLPRFLTSSIYMFVGKVMFALGQDPMAHRGSRIIALLIRDLGARKGWVVSITPRPLYPRERPVPIIKETGWAPGPIWTCAENLAPTGNFFAY